MVPTIFDDWLVVELEISSIKPAAALAAATLVFTKFRYIPGRDDKYPF